MAAVYDQVVIYIPLLGVVHPLLTLTHTPQTVLPHWWCVYCSSGVPIRTQCRILGISLLGDHDILSVLVCFASVCIIVPGILKQCFIVVRFY